jgi:tetratricopeptide (TPR) repeat protein
MKLNVTRKTAVILVVTAFLVTSLNAQERNDVIKAYNEGARSMKTDYQLAITAFETVIALSEQVGESADDLKGKAEKVLPGLYFKVAYAALNEKKPAPEVIQAAKKAAEVADKYGSVSNKKNSDKVLINAYNSLAGEFMALSDYDNALLSLDSILLVNPGYISVFFNKALLYKKQDNADGFEESIDIYLEKLASINDEDKSKKASLVALEYFRGAGSRESQAENLDGALDLLNKAAKYGDDKDLFYFYADVYNKKENFEKGEEFAQKGLGLETGDAEAKAKFYYQLAVAQVGKGQNTEACTSFKNALYGAFAAASKAQRTNLKCE